MPAPRAPAPSTTLSGGAALRMLPEETPVAMVFDGASHAVMMATPADLEDFALGFALSEGIARGPSDLGAPEIVAREAGIEARMWLSPDRAEALAARRRALAGPVGCGLCGIESLEQALRPLAPLPADALRIPAAEVAAAPDALRALQPLHAETRATHAAGFLVPGRGVVLAREDVGRHNALDKLIGALARAGIDPASGAAVLTSRVSTEMVQKAVSAGIPAVIAVSAPTAAALRIAQGAGLTLAAFARGGGAEIFAHPARIVS
ncbi:formate dehydrogenase accessory sulfurtransferase FdhD [Rhodovulum sp. DZ06]|uniref:formate dehydrogenase accessory sulfurtransferase FdhD n=1 Tax=Rhodovulum sp. DZ06 TaxID=3425126 RepID=UPI003D331CDB